MAFRLLLPEITPKAYKEGLMLMKRKTDEHIKEIHLEKYQLLSFDREDRVQPLTYTQLDIFGEAPWLLLALYKRQDLIDCIRKHEFGEGPGCFDPRIETIEDIKAKRIYVDDADELNSVMIKNGFIKINNKL